MVSWALMLVWIARLLKCTIPSCTLRYALRAMITVVQVVVRCSEVRSRCLGPVKYKDTTTLPYGTWIYLPEVNRLGTDLDGRAFFAFADSTGLRRSLIPVVSSLTPIEL